LRLRSAPIDRARLARLEAPRECERRVAGVEHLLRDWCEKERTGAQLYLEYEPVTPRDRLVVEDLAVTMLMNSRVAARAATSLCRKCSRQAPASKPEPNAARGAARRRMTNPRSWREM
jgi:hypothetical protein